MEERSKKLLRIVKSSPAQVGDGFTIRRPMPGNGIEGINPFLMFDHAGPTTVGPSERALGVDEHPHKGFETVTVVLQGEIAHRDSAGHSGLLGPGGVQWMTAGSGLVHEEKYGPNVTRNGGTIEMVQLWVNLPARHKGEAPGYQDIEADRIPTVELPEGGGSARVIAGELQGTEGPARTFTPVTLLEITLQSGARVSIPRPEGHTTGVYALRGAVEVAEGEVVREGEMAGYGVEGTRITLHALEESRLLLIGGEPIDEPVAAYGPFVMNTMDEIREAMSDYRSGKMGHLEPA